MSEEIKNDAAAQQEETPAKENNGVAEEVKSEENTETAGEVKSEEKPVEKNGTEETSAEAKTEVTPELLTKIKKQVEFYFGDVNMQKDKFLIEQTRLDEGWVPMTVMLNFKILASLSKDIEVILNALEDSDLIEISEDRKKIRRSLDKPLPVYNDEYRKAQEARTIYLKGFPMDSTIEILKSHFETTDDVETIIMRRYKVDKQSFFKGSIFLQFKTLEAAKAFMEQESVKYKDTELIKMWSADYSASKEKEREERRQKKAKNQLDKMENAKGNKNKEQHQKFKVPKGCVLHISNLEKSITREKIKKALAELDSEVAYVDYNIGDIEGYIRLQGENSAVELLKKLENNVLKVEEREFPCKLLEGEEEETYLAKIQENMASHREKRSDKGRHHGRKGFKRRHSPHRDGNAKRANKDN
ncbi:la protein homolog [Nasonia vitripennis]|uniref:La protein homolog n=1 Tax=Nasonia vitripennis TaxID=7425 RepID=A0A7M7IYU5_NASVI|nr:la protein homolog [Nasonia vitripennis]